MSQKGLIVSFRSTRLSRDRARLSRKLKVSQDSLSKKSPLCTLSRNVWCANLLLSLAQKSAIIIFIVNVAVGNICQLLEMGSSWNFPARASPSCEVSEPSRAKLGHFNFRAETKLTIPTICMSNQQVLLKNCSCSMVS